jgi:hypothetical protein
VLLAAGCVHLVAPYDAQIESETLAAARSLDRFYGDLLEEDERQRPYARFKERYVQIETDLRALVLRNEIRPLNEDSAGIARDILALWTQKKERHRTRNGYATGAARLDRDRFVTLFRYALRAERAKGGSTPVAHPEEGRDGDGGPGAAPGSDDPADAGGGGA